MSEIVFAPSATAKAGSTNTRPEVSLDYSYDPEGLDDR
jgi:hypothetical protein